MLMENFAAPASSRGGQLSRFLSSIKLVAVVMCLSVMMGCFYKSDKDLHSSLSPGYIGLIFPLGDSAYRSLDGTSVGVITATNSSMAVSVQFPNRFEMVKIETIVLSGSFPPAHYIAVSKSDAGYQYFLFSQERNDDFVWYDAPAFQGSYKIKSTKDLVKAAKIAFQDSNGKSVRFRRVTGSQENDVHAKVAISAVRSQMRGTAPSTGSANQGIRAFSLTLPPLPRPTTMPVVELRADDFGFCGAVFKLVGDRVLRQPGMKVVANQILDSAQALTEVGLYYQYIQVIADDAYANPTPFNRAKNVFSNAKSTLKQRIQGLSAQQALAMPEMQQCRRTRLRELEDYAIFPVRIEIEASEVFDH